MIHGEIPALTGQNLLESVPGLAEIARIRLVPFCNIDSSQMTPDIWLKLPARGDALLALGMANYGNTAKLRRVFE